VRCPYSPPWPAPSPPPSPWTSPTALPARPAQKYPLSYLNVAAGSIFHQCVYLLCAKSPEALAAAQQAREAYGMAGPKPYMPHLSLLYSDIDEATRQQVGCQGVGPRPGRAGGRAGLGAGPGWRLRWAGGGARGRSGEGPARQLRTQRRLTERAASGPGH
jgi:hypothetical protein